MNPNGFVEAAVDCFPDIHVEVGSEHRELVDQSDVDMPECVLEELHHLGHLGTRYGHDAIDERGVESLN